MKHILFHNTHYTHKHITFNSDCEQRNKDCMSSHNSTTIIKFADDTVVVDGWA